MGLASAVFLQDKSFAVMKQGVNVGLASAVFRQDKSFAVLPSQTVYTRLSSYINVFLVCVKPLSLILNMVNCQAAV